MPIQPITATGTTDTDRKTIDTSFWIEGFIKGASNPSLAEIFPRRDDCIVPVIVYYELVKWLTREADKRTAEWIIGYLHKCTIVELRLRHSFQAATLSHVHRLAMADAMIYATALDQKSTLLTCDRHFEGLPQVVYIPKQKT